MADQRKPADALQGEGGTAEAIAKYCAEADRLARAGRLIPAIAASRRVLELEPGHRETQEAIAALYARGAAEPTEFLAREAHAVAPGPAGRRGPATGFARIQLAAIEVEAEGASPTATSTPTPTPTGLPRFPIFSDLPPAAFVALTGAMDLRRAAEGETILREGDTGTSFYVVAAGRVAVSKRDDRNQAVAVAHLREGDFFGEMALLTGAPRTATVVAAESCELLEIRAEALLEVARAHPQLAASIRRFYRQRLLANAMALSPIFRPFAKDDRRRVMDRFRAREVSEGEKVIREGEPSDGLYVVLDGTVEVVKRRGAGDVVVGRLREGDVFGEMSCLRKTAATATVVVRRGGSLLKLPRRDFDELVLSHPQILEAVADLSDERAGSLDAILAGHAQWTEDGLVLI